jgi:two-component system, OmpR family, sensor histidine kinase MtrB
MSEPKAPDQRSSRVGFRAPRGLRVRIAVTFALGALLIVAVMSITTYLVAARYLVDQRERTAQRQSFVDARIVRDSLSTTNDPDVALSLLELGPNSTAAIYRDGGWIGSAKVAQEDAIPAVLRREAIAGSPVHQRYNALGTPRFTMGVPLPGVHATYFEVTALVELRSTLVVLRNVLIGTSIATTLAAILVGISAGRRVLRPVREISRVAATIAAGDLAARLSPRGDPDLDSVVDSFNGMADALEARIDRDARFVSDVSHELRSPLTTLATTAGVLERRRPELPERLLAPMDLLVAEIGHFREVVEELLELSRAESGAEPLQLEPVRLPELVRQVIRRSAPTAKFDFDSAVDAGPMLCDKRRVERALTNLVVNAETHGRGLGHVRLERVDSVARITLDDQGPGIPPADRDRVFDRFYRGQRSGARGDTGGAGLGLALVAEHVRVHGGTVHLEAGPGGVGTRAVMEIPWLDG